MATNDDEEKQRVLLEKQALQARVQFEKQQSEEIEYNKFPTILGWYFDGFFPHNFTLNEEYAEHFTELELELLAVRDYEIAETFLEKIARNFWPPSFHCGCFRTKGVYLDFKETKEDPPRTPPVINYESPRAIIGLRGHEEEEKKDESTHVRFGQAEFSPVPKADDIKDRWYWDDEADLFLPKQAEEEYFFQEHAGVWKRPKVGTSHRTPYDWYFDDKEGNFFVLDKHTPDAYFFENDPHNVWKKKGVDGPTDNGLSPADYYFDENLSKWFPRSSAPETGTEHYHNGRREHISGPRGKSGLGPEDFYYDSESGNMRLKDPLTPEEYYYDPKETKWNKVGQPYGPSKAGTLLYPEDWIFNNSEGVWQAKPEAERVQASPYDWFFDDALGRFYKRNKTKPELYAFDHTANLWKLEGTTGPSANGLNSEDYFYDEEDNTWKLLNLIEADKIDMHEPGRRKIKIGHRGKSKKVEDDYYYDGYEGKFKVKDVRKLQDYVYDIVDEVFKKREQPYGPGKQKLYATDYYWNDESGIWMPKSVINEKKRPEPLLRSKPDHGPYDWYFDDHLGIFKLRNLEKSYDYPYNPATAVHHSKTSQGPSVNGKAPSDYYFDEYQGQWFLIDSERGKEANDYPNGHRFNRNGQRGKSKLIPDDLYFDTMAGKFVPKAKHNPDGYWYDTQCGVWKMNNCPPGPGKNKLIPGNYYFDDEAGEFLLKRDLTHGEIFLDKNTRLWKIKRRHPKDFYWDPHAAKWIRKTTNPPVEVLPPEESKKDANNKAEDKPKVGQEFKGGEKSKAEEKSKEDKSKEEKSAAKDNKERPSELIEAEENAAKEEGGWKTDLEYNKPWLHNYPHLAANESRYDSEMRRIEEAKKAKEKEKAEEDKKTKRGLKSAPSSTSQAPSKAAGPPQGSSKPR